MCMEGNRLTVCLHSGWAKKVRLAFFAITMQYGDICYQPPPLFLLVYATASPARKSSTI